MLTTLFRSIFKKPSIKHHMTLSLEQQRGLGFPKKLSASSSPGRKQRVRDSISQILEVTFGVIQGSFLEPDLYTVFIDELLQLIKHLSVGVLQII